jgi:hypothetical protein
MFNIQIHLQDKCYHTLLSNLGTTGLSQVQLTLKSELFQLQRMAHLRK